ncbi:MAG: Rrf2 family transcriptional regulator [Candidatus Nanopelagicales bacterium]
MGVRVAQPDGRRTAGDHRRTACWARRWSSPSSSRRPAVAGHDVGDPHHRHAGRRSCSRRRPRSTAASGLADVGHDTCPGGTPPRGDSRAARAIRVRWNHAGVRARRLRDARARQNWHRSTAPNRTDWSRARNSPTVRDPGVLEGILNQLRRSGFVASQRGADGGYRLARPAAQITVADVIRSLEGPLAAVRGEPPEDTEYAGPAGHLRDVWVATRASMRAVLEHVTLADIAEGHLPAGPASLLDQPGAWERR